jgi:ATP-dependent exoDNAse (exonuclease V) beta subunit
MNLIYVALTRARKRLIVIHDESRVASQKHICSIFSLIPRNLYSVEGDIQTHLETIEQKLNARRQLVDEDAPFAQMNRI